MFDSHFVYNLDLIVPLAKVISLDLKRHCSVISVARSNSWLVASEGSFIIVRKSIYFRVQDVACK